MVHELMDVSMLEIQKPNKFRVTEAFSILNKLLSAAYTNTSMQHANTNTSM